MTHKRARTKREFTREQRHTVVLTCRPCHKQIHAILTEPELARGYHTREALLAHPEIARFVAWIAKQPATADIPVRQRK